MRISILVVRLTLNQEGEGQYLYPQPQWNNLHTTTITVITFRLQILSSYRGRADWGACLYIRGSIIKIVQEKQAPEIP